MKKILTVVGIVVAALILIVVALPFVIDVNKFKPTIETNISDALGRKVEIGNISLAILSGGVSVDSVVIADDPAFSRRFRCCVPRRARGIFRPWARADRSRNPRTPPLPRISPLKN